MIDGISLFLDQQTTASTDGRAQFWHPDFSSQAAYDRSVGPNRARLAHILGVVDARDSSPALEYVSSPRTPGKVADAARFSAYAVRWSVFAGIHGEGLLLEPKGLVTAQIVAVPDADQTPEEIAGIVPGLPPSAQFARILAESGCRVIIPTLVDRSDKYSAIRS